MADDKKKKKGKGKPAASSEPATPPRLRQVYADQVAPELMKKFAYGNVMQIPRL